MKVRELNALLNKLAKANPDADVQLLIPVEDSGEGKGDLKYVEPWVGLDKDTAGEGATSRPNTIVVIPKEIEDAIKSGLPEEKMRALLQQEARS